MNQIVYIYIGIAIAAYAVLVFAFYSDRSLLVRHLVVGYIGLVIASWLSLDDKDVTGIERLIKDFNAGNIEEGFVAKIILYASIALMLAAWFRVKAIGKDEDELLGVEDGGFLIGVAYFFMMFNIFMFSGEIPFVAVAAVYLAVYYGSMEYDALNNVAYKW